MPSRRTFIRSVLAAGAAATGLGAYATRVEPEWIEIVHRPMPIAGLPAALDGATLVQLSDLHVGPLADPDYLAAALRRAGSLRPDIIALTGDFVTYRSPADVETLARVLEHLPHGRLATVAVLGNHDYGAAWTHPEIAESVVRRVREAGVTVLRNERLEVAGLQVIGIDDLWGPLFDPAVALAGLPKGAPTVTLCHNPDAVDLPVWGDLGGWVLAGHTHGGQCRPPFLPPPILPVRNTRYTAGVFDVGGGRTLYINRGLGWLIRVRFNARPEITAFTLRRAGRDGSSSG